MSAGILLLSALFLAPTLATAGNDSDVQAAFLTKLAVFVTWPKASFTSSGAPIVTCALNAPRIANSLEEVISGVSARGRSFEVRRIERAEEAGGCHMVVIGSGSRRAQRSLARQLRGKSMLTVATSRYFAEDGGMVGMETHRGRIAFEVNVESAKTEDLKISSKLLRLASRVY